MMMNPVLTTDISEVIEAVHYLPAVSIIMPIVPKMSLKTALNRSLNFAADKVEREINHHYPNELGVMVVQKLKALIRNLDFDPSKKSIAIYVSPLFEKVLFLDISVEEKIIIDESFEIRDLVYSKKQLHKYLVLMLSGNESRLLIGNGINFVKIISNTPESVLPNNFDDLPEKTGKYSEKSEQKELLLDKFLHYIDNSLDPILKAYQLPLFVLGADKILGHYKKLSKYKAAIIGFVPGNFEDADHPMLLNKLEPYIKDWKKVIEKELMNQLEESAGQKKLAIGIEDVWREAMNLKGRLLVVEKNYMHAAQRGGRDGLIHEVIEPYNRFSYIKDAVDDVIEKILQHGGDVEFVDEGVLKDYQQIALIQFY